MLNTGRIGNPFTFNLGHLGLPTTPEIPHELLRLNSCAQAAVRPYLGRVEAQVTPRRFLHVLRVTALACDIAERNHFTLAEQHATAQAAILHDVGRELTPEQTFALIPPSTELERHNPLSLHGKAGRKIAEAWGVRNTLVLEAIEGHVFGIALENRVGMAVYTADVSEPGREVNHDIRELAKCDLFAAYRRAVSTKVTYLQSKGKAVHPDTMRVYCELCDLT